MKKLKMTKQKIIGYLLLLLIIIISVNAIMIAISIYNTRARIRVMEEYEPKIDLSPVKRQKMEYIGEGIKMAVVRSSESRGALWI